MQNNQKEENSQEKTEKKIPEVKTENNETLAMAQSNENESRNKYK